MNAIAFPRLSARSAAPVAAPFAALALNGPLAAQDQAQPPVVPSTEAPGLPAAIDAPAVEAAPTAPAAESAAPATQAPLTLQGEAPAAPAATAPTPAADTGTVTTAPAPGTAAPATTTEPAATTATLDATAPVAPLSTEAGAEVAAGGALPVADAPAASAPALPGIEHGLPHELSAWGMFMAADIIVKAVMVGLAFATFVTLTILVYKFFEVAFAHNSLRRSLNVIRDSASLSSASSSLAGRRDPASFMTHAALDELRRSQQALDVAGNDGVKERTRSIVERTEAQAGRRLMRGTGILATIGSTAPFVGLFGTVWGIMNSFIGIAESQTTNLAVVAPGIAEALLATAIGLVAAIPAVVIYNHFARQIQGYRLKLGDAGAGVERLLSRDLDFRHVAAL